MQSKLKEETLGFYLPGKPQDKVLWHLVYRNQRLSTRTHYHEVHDELLDISVEYFGIVEDFLDIDEDILDIVVDFLGFVA